MLVFSKGNKNNNKTTTARRKKSKVKRGIAVDEIRRRPRALQSEEFDASVDQASIKAKESLWVRGGKLLSIYEQDKMLSMLPAQPAQRNIYM